MEVGIIGSGHIGGTLTRRLQQLGHAVFLANSRGPESLAELARETGARPVTVPEAATHELVVVSIPLRNIPQLAGMFLNAAPDLPLVDTSNYYPRNRDGRIPAIEGGMPESRWVEQQLDHGVVKAFNNIFAQHLLDRGLPEGAPGRIALPVAGDHAEAKAKVMALVNQLGFDPVDAGSIAESWRQQPGTPVYASDFDAAGVRRALAQAAPGRRPEWRAA